MLKEFACIRHSWNLQFGQLLVCNIIFRGSQLIFPKSFCAFGVIQNNLTHLNLNWLSSWMKQSKINKKHTPVLPLISSFEGISYGNFKIRGFTSADLIFYKFVRTAFSLIWKNIFAFISRFIHPLLHHPFPFDSQNLLSIKAFCWYSFMWEANFLNASLYGSRIQGRIGINWGIGFKQKKLFWKHLY